MKTPPNKLHMGDRIELPTGTDEIFSVEKGDWVNGSFFPLNEATRGRFTGSLRLFIYYVKFKSSAPRVLWPGDWLEVVSRTRRAPVGAERDQINFRPLIAHGSATAGPGMPRVSPHQVSLDIDRELIKATIVDLAGEPLPGVAVNFELLSLLKA